MSAALAQRLRDAADAHREGRSQVRELCRAVDAARRRLACRFIAADGVGMRAAHSGFGHAVECGHLRCSVGVGTGQRLTHTAQARGPHQAEREVDWPQLGRPGQDV